MRLTVLKVTTCVAQMEHIGAVNKDRGSSRLAYRLIESIEAIYPGCSNV